LHSAHHERCAVFEDDHAGTNGEREKKGREGTGEGKGGKEKKADK